MVLERFNCFLWAKEWFASEKEWIAPVALLSWATWENRSQSLFCKEWLEWIAQVALLKKSKWAPGQKKGNNCQKHTKKRIFKRIAHFFVSNRLNLNHDWITNFQSFLKSELLTVALLYRVTCANRSWSIFKMIDFEQKSEEQMSERANSQPWCWLLSYRR